MSKRRAVTYLSIGLGLGATLMSASCGDGTVNPPSGTIVVTSPVAGTKLLTGDTILVTWDLAVTNPTFQGNYNYTGSAWLDLVMVAKVSDVSARVALPNTVRQSTSFQIKVSDASGKNQPGVSGNCPIKHILLTYPLGGDTLTQGNTVDIKWRASSQEIASSLNVYVSTNNGMTLELILSGSAVLASLGKYSWTIGGEGKAGLTYPSSTCFVKIEDYQDNSITDESAIFTVK